MILLALAQLLILVIYARSRNGGFLFDDHAITDMEPHFLRWELAWTGKIYKDRPARFRYALQTLVFEPRSLTHMGYLWTWKAAGRRLKPFTFHVVNVWLHQWNTLLVYLLAYSIRPSIAGAAALIFAIHPHQVAAVSYISGRAVLQSTFFALAGAYITLFSPFWIVGLLAWVFAYLSKEDGFLWVLVFLMSFAVLRFCFGSI
jgi:hypothetical protein